jgi:His/Glu/Gln/Arg/opine family amino acid ABC transporter permease subunit
MPCVLLSERHGRDNSAIGNLWPMDIDLFYTWDALPRLLWGAGVTLELAIAAMALSLAVSAAFTLLRESGGSAAQAAVRAYISYIRGTPLLVQILLVYYGLPRLGLELSPLAAGIVALGLSSAAYTTEIIRGGLAAIPGGQIEAALALGLRRFPIWSRIIFPQVYHFSLPPLVNELTQLIKGTPLVSVIAVIELMRIAQQIYNDKFRPLEVLLGVALVFFVMNFVLLRIAAALERRNPIR